jgi:hypothetical protein
MCFLDNKRRHFLGEVAHAYILSYLRVRVWKDCNWGPS